MMDAPATLRMLLLELTAFLSAETKAYKFPSPEGKWLDCRVFLHGLPEGLEDEVYPFVLVRWLGGEVESDESGATHVSETVALVLGVHSPRAQAEAGLLLAELVDNVRRALWKIPLLAKRYRLAEPLKFTAPDLSRRVHRFHMATVETVWNYAWPQKILEYPPLSRLCGSN